MVRVGLLVGVILLPLLSFACGDGKSSDDGRVQVVTTLPLFADFVREIGRDRVEVFSLVPLGADPHTFEPSPRDVERITEADIAFANGLGLEPALIKVLEANLRDGATLILLAEYAKEAGEVVGLPEVGDDPHLWMHPGYAQQYARLVKDVLSSLSGDEYEGYEANYKNYLDHLSAIDEYDRYQIDAVPAALRKLVTTHDAFGYFGVAYGLEVVAAVARSPGQEPSPQDIADLRAEIQREGVPISLTEPQISAESEILEQAAEDAGVQVCTLYSDSLDDEVSTYIEMMRFNADELARCLGGDDGG